MQNANEAGNAFMLAGAHDLVIRNNVLKAFKHINTGGGGNSRLTIVNNTFGSDLSFPVEHWPVGIGLEDCPNSTVKNNIFYNLPGAIYYITGSSWDGLSAGNNLAFRADGRAPSGEPFPGDMWGVDPGFRDPAGDWHLKAGSACVDAGAPLGDLVPNDYYGVSRPQGKGLDVGACELEGSTPAAPAPQSPQPVPQTRTTVCSPYPQCLLRR